MEPTYRERMDAAHERLAAALDPQTDQERAIVAWAGKAWDLPTLETLSGLIERAINAATAEAFERGWREAGGAK